MEKNRQDEVIERAKTLCGYCDRLVALTEIHDGLLEAVQQCGGRPLVRFIVQDSDPNGSEPGGKSGMNRTVSIGPLPYESVNMWLAENLNFLMKEIMDIRCEIITRMEGKK